MDVASGGLERALGIEFIEWSVERVVARMPVEPNRQPAGRLHGGATLALGESVGSLAACLYAETLGKIPVGVDVNGTHHRAARKGWVTAVATPLHLGR
ncbi:MAG: hotdog fold thioesterase, partial [Bifidobacteriaceae bacterium]|nr:hotdog fold thioesterase [Bifidobacteriaceae bacterium]